MKKRKSIRKVVIAVALITAVVAAYTFSPLSTIANDEKNNDLKTLKNDIFAKDNGAETTAALNSKSTFSDSTGASATEKKEETVYVCTDSAGEQQDVIVSDHLSNKSVSDKIVDKTNLKNIKNVKGDEKCKKSKNGKLVWNAEGNEIHYQGSTDKTAPIDMDVTYKLDGKKISGSDIQGKSGQVEIRIKYTNNASVDVDGTDTAVPFVAITGMYTTSESFSDVKVSSGKVIDEGEKLIIGTLAMPGIDMGSFSSSGIDIGDEVVIKGTAENFAITDMITVVTSDLLNDVDTSSLSKLDDLDEKIALLESSGKKLEQGAAQLYAGVNQLYKNTDKLISGTEQMSEGADQLEAGTKKSKDGADELAYGSKLYAVLVNTSIDNLKSSSLIFSEKTSNLYSGVKQVQTLISGDGTEENQGLTGSLSSLAKGSTSVYSKISKIQKGIDGTGESTGIKDEAYKVWKESESVNNTGSEAEAYVEKGLEYTEQLKESLDALYKSEVISESAYAKLIGSVDKAIEYQTGADEKLDSINEMSESAEKVYNGIETISEGIDGDNGLLEGSKKVAVGANTIYSSAAMLQSAFTGNQSSSNIVSSAEDVRTGASALTSEISDLNDTASELGEGAIKIADGAQKLADGQKKLYSGAKKLADAMEQLEEKSGTLASGVAELNSGSKKLSSGMSQYYSQGIKQLVDFYYATVGDITDSVTKLVEAGKKYDTFTAKTDDRKGSVKFIYKTAVDDSE